MRIEELIEQGDAAYYSAQYDKAIEYYKQVLESSPRNKHARAQLKKAEVNRSLSPEPPNIPTSALQLYKQARSFIAARDLPQARKLLKEAIAISRDEGVDFVVAQELLANLTNALTAQAHKKQAFEAIDTQDWANAEVNLESASTLDPTDDTPRMLLSQLRNLLEAQKSIEQLQAGFISVLKRRNVISTVREVIEETKEASTLSKLWQEIMRDFGEYNRKNIRVQGIVLSILSYIFISLIAIWYLFIFPSNYIEIQCEGAIPGLIGRIKYPAYIATGDDNKLEITIINNSDIVISGSVIVDFGGTALVQLIDPTNSSTFEFKDFSPKGRQSETIYFSLFEPFSLISDPSKYINMNVYIEGYADSCEPKDMHMAMAPITHIRSIWGWLIGTSGLVAFVTALLWDQFLNLFRKGKSAEKDES